MALIQLSDVTVSFEGVNAVEHASFEINRGDCLAILGENGSGKSTLVRAMLGLVHPQSGQIRYGEGLRRDQIGYLPQQTAAQRDFPASVEEVVLSGCANRSGAGRFFYGREARRKALDKLRLLDIERLRKKSYRNLSGGQQQRVLLARALCATDALLLLDEPVTGLDPAAQQELYALLRELNREHGVGIGMVSHDLAGAMTCANRVLVVDRGVSFFGDPEGYQKFRRERGANV